MAKFVDAAALRQFYGNIVGKFVPLSSVKHTPSSADKIVTEQDIPSSATQISYSPATSGLTADDVQEAIDELSSEKQPKSITDTGSYFTTDTVEGALQEVGADLLTKQNLPSQITTGTSITLADNTEYRLTDVSELTIAYPQGSFECWLKITTAASGTVTITMPSSTYIGSAPTFGNGEVWEMSIKDGVIAAVKVGDGQ